MQIKKLYQICSILLAEGLEDVDIELGTDRLYLVIDEDSISPAVRADLEELGALYDEYQDCFAIYLD